MFIMLLLILRIIKLSYELNNDVNYFLLINMVMCLYWFEEKVKWILDGCRVRYFDLIRLLNINLRFWWKKMVMYVIVSVVGLMVVFYSIYGL